LAYLSAPVRFVPVKKGIVLAITLLFSGHAQGTELEDMTNTQLASEATHTLCMMKLREGPAIALHDRFRPLVDTEEQWDKLVSVVLEAWHVACFSLLGTTDNREEDNQMPWVDPGPICQSTKLSSPGP